MVAAWIAALLAFGLSAATLRPAFTTAFEIPSSPSASGFELLNRYFPKASPTGSIVFSSDTGVMDQSVKAEMEDFFKRVSGLGIQVSSPYDSDRGSSQVSMDGKVAFAPLGTDPSLDQGDLAALGSEMLSLRPTHEGLTVEISGSSFAEFHPPESEALGLALAVVILVLALGSVLAMGLSVLSALTGVLLGTALVFLLSNVVSMPDFSTTLGSMLGLAVGIDYALFILARFREYRSRGLSVNEAVLESLDTAGRSVLFAGITVVVSLLGMLLVGLRFVSGLGLASAATVLVTLAASLTLLPAFLVLAAGRIEVTRRSGMAASVLVSIGLVGVAFSVNVLIVALPLSVLVAVFGRLHPFLEPAVRPRRVRPLASTFSYRWSRSVQNSPLKFLSASTLALLMMTLPVLSLRLGFSDEGNFTPDTTTRRAYDLLAEGFGPGFNGPLVLVGARSHDPGRYDSLSKLLAADPSVAFATQPIPDPTGQAFVLQVFPKTSPQSSQTYDLVNRLRSELSIEFGSESEIYITGPTAASVDFTRYLSRRLWVFIFAVLAVSFMLLLMVFRSVLVPLKAVVMNLFSIAAAYGVVVAVFQWGWLASLFNVSPAPIDPFVPMMMFAILFGLSMDYEVFLLSRIKEEFDRSNDPVSSVADGLAASAKVISAAAMIMVVVFGGFLLEDVRVVKLFGVGLSVAVLLDATVIRLVLVPATMQLLGSRNWYLPKFLDRVLPRLNVEGRPGGHPATVPSDQASGPYEP